MCVALCLGATSSLPSTRKATSTNNIANGTCTAIKTQAEQYFVFQDGWSSTPQQCLQCELTVLSNVIVFLREVSILPSLAWFPKDPDIIGLLFYLQAVCDCRHEPDALVLNRFCSLVAKRESL